MLLPRDRISSLKASSPTFDLILFLSFSFSLFYFFFVLSFVSSFFSSSRRFSAISPRIYSPALPSNLHEIFLCTHRRRSNCNRVLFCSPRTCSGPPRQSTAHLLSDPFLLPPSHPGLLVFFFVLRALHYFAFLLLAGRKSRDATRCASNRRFFHDEALREAG